tara:strand:+ start:1670 stop:2323 length:654 start_codon:yes stop_codon:yes gene_type:complete
MTIKVKICGIKSINHADACIKGKANMIGLMFYKKSPRFINFKTAKKISDFAEKKISRVGVVANMNIKELKNIIENVNLDYIQFHGNETPNFIKKIKKLKTMKKIKIIKALKVTNKNDISKIIKYRNITNYILIDTKIIKKNDYNFKNKTLELDWNLFKEMKNKKTLILSGALNVKNLKNATNQSGINYVDISSSLETKKGVKNIKKINNFLKLATKL